MTSAHFGGCRRSGTETPWPRPRNPDRQPSGRRQGFVTIVGSRAGSWRRLGCPPVRRRFGTGPGGAISRGKDGSFGPCPRRVLDDVGVRFGGSEHHRIETSSSHTRPRPTRQGSRPPGPGRRRSSEHREPRSTGTGTSALFGGRAPPFHRGTASGALRSTARTASPGYGNRRSSEHRAHGLTGTGNSMLFGESRRPSRRDREPTLFGGSTPHLTETGNRTSSEDRPPISPGQSPRPRWQGTDPRGTATGALRSTARTTSSESSNRHSSEYRAPGSTGTGNRTSSEDRPPISPGPDLATGWTPRPLGQADGALRSTARLASRDRATGAPRSPARQDPSGTGHWAPRSTAPPPTRDRDPDLLGGPAPPPRFGQGPPASPRQPEFLGAPRARTRDWNPGPLRRTGPSISRDIGHPALRGMDTGDPRAGTTECTPPASADWRSATEPRPRPEHQRRAGR
jgi:hypothetical protein